MANGDLSADMGLGILAPASSISAISGHAPPQDAEGKSRRRPVQRDGDEPNLAPEPEQAPAHELDSLA
jgi:hypothetical protein